MLSFSTIDTFVSRDELAAAGYVLLMNEIYEFLENMPLSESVIRQMHSRLMRLSVKDERQRGEYKRVENNIIAAFDRKGRKIGIVFETASALETPQLMDKLIQWTNTELIEKRLPALIVIGIFIFSFLTIHPFEDGNGRLSRALTVLLLLRSGYAYVPYSSPESVIEATKESYYISLRTTQKTLECSEPDWNIWILYFLKTLLKQARNLGNIIKAEHLLRVLPETSLRVIELIKAQGLIGIAEA